MAGPTDLRKGKVIIYNGAPHVVLNMLHRTQGRQAGFVQTTLRNLDTGSSTTTKFRSTDTVEICHTTNKNLEYSFKDTEGYHFMDTESYEDTLLPESIIGEDIKWLIEGAMYAILFVDDKAVSLELPNTIEMKVIEASDGIKGDTSSSPSKPVTLETGIVVQVPLFIKNGEVLKIRTDDSTYVSRA